MPNTSGTRVAILIEDKIRAGFQKDQAKRYRERGWEGSNVQPKRSGRFFTCLVAPEKYSVGNAGFDARVSLEALLSFFSAPDLRTQFKAMVLRRALQHFSSTGIQNVDACMTAFRAYYAQQAQKFLNGSDVEWEAPRDAWYDDTWFNFESGAGRIVYKPRMGSVELQFPNSTDAQLHEVLQDCSHSEGVACRQVGKNSAAFYLSIKPIEDFSDPEVMRPTIEQSLESVTRLSGFYVENRDLLQSKLGR